MAKRIKNYGVAVCRSVSLDPGRVWETPNWRDAYVGRTGRLELMESQYKRPGQQFLHFYGGDGWDEWALRTWFGTAEQDDRKIVFTAKNCVYVFELEVFPWKN